MKQKLFLIWNILRAQNFSAVVKVKRGGLVIINADKDNAKAHLVLLYNAHKQAGLTEDDAQEANETKEKED